MRAAKYLILIRKPACYPIVRAYIDEEERDMIYKRYKDKGKYYDVWSDREIGFSSIDRANILADREVK